MRPLKRILVCTIIICFCPCSHAQTIDAPRAQRLVLALLAEHPEMQTIGLHMRVPGQQVNTNIACSKPWKIGKVSAPIEMEVLRSGAPYLRHTPLGAIDMGLTFADRSGRTLGVAVIVLRQTFTQDDSTAMSRAKLIRDQLSARIASRDELLAGARIAQGPLFLVAQVPLPEFHAPFDGIAFNTEPNAPSISVRAGGQVGTFSLEGDPVRLDAAAIHWSSPEVNLTAVNRNADLRVVSSPAGLAIEAFGKDGSWKPRTAFPDHGATAVLWDRKSEHLFAAYPASEGQDAGLFIYQVFPE